MPEEDGEIRKSLSFPAQLVESFFSLGGISEILDVDGDIIEFFLIVVDEGGILILVVVAVLGGIVEVGVVHGHVRLVIGLVHYE